MATTSTVPEPTRSNHSNSYKVERKKRIRSFTAADRACHRVIERQRREALNEGFLDLARLIPALAPVRRLSKSLIVQESTRYLREQRAMRLAAAEDVQALIDENQRLTAELNSWRATHGGEYAGEGIAPYQASAATDALQQLMSADQEVFGTFPAGFGDNGQVEEGGHGDQNKENEEEKEADSSRSANNMDGDEMVNSQLLLNNGEENTLQTAPAPAPPPTTLDNILDKDALQVPTKLMAFPNNNGRIPEHWETSGPIPHPADLASNFNSGFGPSVAPFNDGYRYAGIQSAHADAIPIPSPETDLDNLFSMQHINFDFGNP